MIVPHTLKDQIGHLPTRNKRKMKILEIFSYEITHHYTLYWEKRQKAIKRIKCLM